MPKGTRSKITEWLSSKGQSWLGLNLTPQPTKKELLREKFISDITNRLRGVKFLPWLDPVTEETSEVRAAYRKMLSETSVKAPLLNKLLSVASLEFSVLPASDSERDADIADFVTHAISGSAGGVRKYILSLGTALIDGFSVVEPIWKVRHTRRWGQRIVIDTIKNRTRRVNDIQFDVDEFDNIEGVQSLMTGASFNPALFIIYQHLALFENPLGMSDLRAAYKHYLVKDTAMKLWSIGIEKFTHPLMVGKYDSDAENETKALLEEALEQVKGSTWMAIPDDVKIEIIEMSLASANQFEASTRYQDEQMILSILGAVLQSIEGRRTGSRAGMEVHKDVTEILKWHLAAEMADVINKQLVPNLVDLNWAGVAEDEYPRVVFQAVTERDLLESAKIDDLLLNKLGMPLSKNERYAFYGRKRPTDESDVLKPRPTSSNGALGQLDELKDASEQMLDGISRLSFQEKKN